MTAGHTDSNALTQLAKAVASGSDVDWSTAESTADDPDLRRAMAELKIVAQLAVACRSADDPQEPLPTDSSAPAPLKSWGRLEIRRELGRGRFGTVYLAWDPALECEVALKIMHDAEHSAAVIQEARLLARVRHPNVVTVHGVDQYDRAVGLRMEFVEGLSLKQALAAHGVLGAHEAALIGIDLCRALAAVHKAGLLHRDIKTHNVMREAGGRIVLMDFGAGEIRTAELHTPRLRTGTPLYLAPEIFGGQPSTIASDIYSLGVLLFHLVTLNYPVPGDTIDAVREAHARGSRVALADLRPDLPSGFVRVVELALDRDPARRYRSAGAMQQDLAAALELDVPLQSGAPAHGLLHRASTPSIAVLPFVNLGPDQDIEYLCDGLAEELLIGLGKLSGLRVASRTSSRALQMTTDVRTICRQLDVSAVLEGTVRKSGDRLRITAQLVSAEDGCHIWSEGYNRDMADVLGVQEGIAQNVVDRLQLTLAEVQAARLTRQHTDNPRAYHLYLKGRFYWARRYHAGLTSALEHFQKAIKEDAGYALAYAGVADAYTFMGFYSLQRPRDAFVRASAAALRALEIDPDLAEAHTSLALVKLGGDWDFAAAEHELRQALELDPGQALSRIYLAWVLVLRGDPASGLVEARRAQEIEPLSPLVNAGVGFTLYMSRRYDEAIAECEKSLEIDPNLLLAMHFMAMCRAQQSRLSEAIALSERTVAMSDRAPFYLGLLGHFCARAGARERVDELLAELGRLAERKYVPPHCMAYIYAGLNDLDRAFEWQAKAYDDGASPFNYFSPVIDNMQHDARHAVELRRMGLRL
jgi:serine/threonine protein kinase/tetratricopeptide (TPR) repeat protein